MVGRRVDKKDEIRAYIKARSKLGCSLKKLMTEISTAFGPSCVSYDTVRRWKKKFESGVESIKNAPKSGRPKSASRKEIVSKIKEIIEGDTRFTVRDIARKVGISLSTVHLILKKHLKVRKISARWVPHLLTDEQKRQRVKVAKKLLQMFPKYDKKQFAIVVTGDETWVHYFEPVRKVSNKIWATKHSKRPIIAKRSLSTKKVLHAIFSGEGVAIKVPVKKRKSITGKYYKDVVLKKLKKCYQKRRPATGFKHVRLLHDNDPAHTSAIVTAFLKKEKVTVLPLSYAAISLRTVDRNIVSPKYQLCTELIDLLLPKCIYCMLGTLIRIDCETSLISIQNTFRVQITNCESILMSVHSTTYVPGKKLGKYRDNSNVFRSI